MKQLFTTLLILLTFSPVIAQEVQYITPPIIREKAYTIEVKDIVATKEDFKFSFTIENKTSDKYLVFELSKITVAFSDQDVYYPRNDEIIVVDPNDKVRRTVKIVGNGDFFRNKIQVEFPKVLVNDQETTLENPADLTTAADQSAAINGIGNLSISGLAWKKDSWSGELLMKTNSFEGMLLLDITKITGKSSTALPIEFKRDKVGKIALISNDKFKSKFSIADIGQTMSGIDLSKAFKLYSLKEIDVPQITIKKVGYVEPDPTVNTNVNLCPAFEKINNLPVKVVIFNTNGICFKLAANGKIINPENSSNVTFDTEYGTNILTLTLSNGQTITDKIYPGEGHVYLSFELINRKGEYKLQRKFDLSGDARKALPDTDNKVKSTSLCKDEIMLDKEQTELIREVTIIRITSDYIVYQDCRSNEEKTINKWEVLAIQYANGYYDKFDYPDNTQTKQNLNLTRRDAEVIELRNSSRTSSSVVYGRTRR
jgi:hypothetical protein